MADPNDMTTLYNTQLSPEEEASFQSWAKKSGRLKDLYDYDLRGAFKANAKGAAVNGHFPDTYKKPNHPTFSDESKYSGQGGYEGGRWSKDNDGRDVFTPSETNLRNMSASQLRDYFQRVEPDAVLDMRER